MLSVLLDPGLLRNELVLLASTPVPDGLGGNSEVWNEVGLLFGMIEPGRQQHHCRRSDARNGHAPDHHPHKGRYPQRHAAGQRAAGLRHSYHSRSGRSGPIPCLPGQRGGPVNPSIKLTLDGLVRALRWKAHDLAEVTERRYLPRETAAKIDAIARRPGKRPAGTRKETHDGSGG